MPGGRGGGAHLRPGRSSPVRHSGRRARGLHDACPAPAVVTPVPVRTPSPPRTAATPVSTRGPPRSPPPRPATPHPHAVLPLPVLPPLWLTPSVMPVPQAYGAQLAPTSVLALGFGSVALATAVMTLRLLRRGR